MIAVQRDLFAALPWQAPSEADEQRGWEGHMLERLAIAPIVACFPGLTGTILERLVSQGRVHREDAGFMDPGDPMKGMIDGKPCTPAKAKRFLADYWKAPFPQFRYSLAVSARSAA